MPPAGRFGLADLEQGVWIAVWKVLPAQAN